MAGPDGQLADLHTAYDNVKDACAADLASVEAHGAIRDLAALARYFSVCMRIDNDG